MLEKIAGRNRLILNVTILVGSLSLLVATYIDHMSYIASTPQKTWRLFLSALENADIQRIQTLTTSRGFGYIGIAEQSESENLSELPYLAELWANPEVRWHIQDEITVIAAVPTPGGDHIFIFVRESNEWKLDRWVRPDS